MSSLPEIRGAVIKAKRDAQDAARKKFLENLHKLVKRDVIVYASSFSDPYNIPGVLLSLNDKDVQHLMSVIAQIKDEQGNSSDELDLIVHSPGGSLAAAEQIVHYLRRKYQFIRVIVPQNAMSAATMIACAADEIWLGYHSALGPTDPQITMSNATCSAQSIINEFNTAKAEFIDDPRVLPLWIQRMHEWPPGLLDDCQRAIDLSRTVVAQWLKKYMRLAKDTASEIADKLANANQHKTHNRPLNFDTLNSWGLKVKRLEDDQKLQEAVLSVFHATTVTFETTRCVKIIENHFGKGISVYNL